MKIVCPGCEKEFKGNEIGTSYYHELFHQQCWEDYDDDRSCKDCGKYIRKSHKKIQCTITKQPYHQECWDRLA